MKQYALYIQNYNKNNNKINNNNNNNENKNKRKVKNSRRPILWVRQREIFLFFFLYSLLSQIYENRTVGFSQD